MSLALSKVLPCPTSQFSRKNFFFKVSLSNFPTASDIEYVRICRTSTQDKRVVCASSSAAGSSSSDHAFNPYQVLGVSPIEGFEEIKGAYTRKCKDAERRGDEATAAQLEKAYDKIMMAQLMNRKKGVTFGSFQYLTLVFVYRIFEKLKAVEPPTSPTFTEDGEDEGRILRMVKRLLRSIALVAGSIADVEQAAQAFLDQRDRSKPRPRKSGK